MASHNNNLPNKTKLVVAFAEEQGFRVGGSRGLRGVCQ